MKRIFQLKICVILLTVLAVGWLWPVRARAEAETDGWYEEDGSLFYYADGELLKSCFAEIDGGFYYFKDDGTLLMENETCMVSDENGAAAWVRAGWDNILIAGDWYIDDGADPAESYYYGNDFAAVCGPSVVDDVFYLFDNDTGVLLRNQKVLVDGAWWESDAQGELSSTGIPADGWAADDDGNRYYYLDGEALSGGFYEIDGQYRFFHDDGHLAMNESLYLDSHWVRFDENGCIVADSGEQQSDSSDGTKENSADPKEENPSDGNDRHSTQPASHPAEGWMTADGERYYYRNGKAISAGRHTIEWTEYYFDGDGRMLHDCIADGHVLDHDGLIVQSGLVTLGDQQYYVNPTTHLIEKNTEVNINSTLYLADAEGRLQQKPLPAEPGMESAADSSRADKGFRDPQGSSDPDSDPDPDADYVPTNEEDTALQEELPAGGSIRYSDNYLPGETPAAGASAPASTAADNPPSGILLWRGGAWQEMHGSAEKPIGVHIFGRDAAILDNGTILRDAFVYSSEGIFGFDQDGNALPGGLASRYGKLFYVTAPDPNAEMLVLLMS